MEVFLATIICIGFIIFFIGALSKMNKQAKEEKSNINNFFL